MEWEKDTKQGLEDWLHIIKELKGARNSKRDEPGNAPKQKTHNRIFPMK